MAMNAKVSLWDNSTQGLDASTSVRFGKSLYIYTHTGRNIAVAALYQASDDLVNLFDKITLLHQGRQIFFGTIDEAKDYFISLGFEWAKRQNIAEFLVAVTDPNVRVTKEGWDDRVPRSVEDFVKCWRESTNWHKLQEELKNQTDSISYDTGLRTFESRSQSANQGHSRRQSMYVLSWTKQL
jgi:ABC-type multidrug transport system ATPase subunit